MGFYVLLDSEEVDFVGFGTKWSDDFVWDRSFCLKYDFGLLFSDSLRPWVFGLLLRDRLFFFAPLGSSID